MSARNDTVFAALLWLMGRKKTAARFGPLLSAVAMVCSSDSFKRACPYSGQVVGSIRFLA